ncbi:MAG: hypothetical protein AB7V04_14180 [Desulfomonilaceae bacterium]
MKWNRSNYNPKFLNYIELFAKIGSDSRIFPKRCGTCGEVFKNFPEYIHKTEPVSHGLEDYTTVLDLPRTMQYRNCVCGSTLTIMFTKDVYPLLEQFWEMLGLESKRTGKPLVEVVTEFREQCNRFITEMEE